MWTCKRVAEALAETNYEDLPRWQCLGLKLHVSLCCICSRYHKGVMVMQDCARILAEREKEGCCQQPDCLPEGAKERIKKRLQDSD